MPHVFRTFKKDGRPHPRWRFEHRDFEGRKRKATGFTSKVETERLARKVQSEQDAVRLEYRPPPKSSQERHAFAAIASEYQAWGEAQGGRGGRPWSERHSRMKRTNLAWWREALGLGGLGELVGSLARVEKALRELKGLGKMGKTVANYAETLSSFCDWCVQRGYLPEDPLKGLVRFDTTPREAPRRDAGGDPEAPPGRLR